MDTNRPRTISGDYNYWADATKFLKTLLVPDAKEKLAKYMIDSEMSYHEAMYFKHLLADAMGFEMTITILKHIRTHFYNKKEFKQIIDILPESKTIEDGNKA